MPRIPNFPQSLLEEHKNWHHARHMVNTNNPPPGYGLEFLRFHRDFIARALAWYRQNGYDPSLVEPWDTVPESIRNSPCYNQAAEARILFRPESFATADEFGKYIEASNIHSCIHQQSADLYGDPQINDFDFAPANTIFYNIHGMIDRWWRNWEGLGRFRTEGGYWCGSFEHGENEILFYNAIFGDWWLGRYLSTAEAKETRVEWASIGDSRMYGPMNDERLFRIWDSDGDGKLEVLFRDPESRAWIEGKVRDGRLWWQPVHLRYTGDYTLTNF